MLGFCSGSVIIVCSAAVQNVEEGLEILGAILPLPCKKHRHCVCAITLPLSTHTLATNSNKHADQVWCIFVAESCYSVVARYLYLDDSAQASAKLDTELGCSSMASLSSANVNRIAAGFYTSDTRIAKASKIHVCGGRATGQPSLSAPLV